jgi:hypothetical protein
MGWGLFGYYPFWFGVTLLTFPGAFIGWFIKKDQWYSGLILSVMTLILVVMGVDYTKQVIDNFPSHLLSAIYCFAIIPVFIFTIFKKKAPRIVCGAITAAILIVFAFLTISNKPYTVDQNTFLKDNGITIVGEPFISNWGSESGTGNVEIIKDGDSYSFKISGTGTSKYYFTITDDANNKEYSFEYFYDKDQKTVIINQR